MRRAVVPDAAGRSLWFAATWTGIGAAVVGATLGVAAVAVCWMPAAGASGHATSTIRAGLLTFLASVHGGITIDGTPTRFLPLGLLVVVGVIAWRAGAGLADAAGDLGEDDPVRLALAGTAQAFAFSGACVVAAPFSRLGTSSVPIVGVALGSLLLFAVTGGVAFVRWSALGPLLRDRLPARTPAVARAVAAAACVYVAAGALLVAGSLLVHRERVDVLLGQAGGGWSGVPVLLLGVLAAPNAVVAATAYLAGPGFSVGAGTTASAFGTAHGVVPAFPLLGALPTGAGATPAVWLLMAVTPAAAGVAAVRVLPAAQPWADRVRDLLAAAAGVGVVLALLAWQGGGAVGSGRLATVGASPWQLGLAGAAGVAAGCGVALAAQWLRIWFSGLASARVGASVGPATGTGEIPAADASADPVTDGVADGVTASPPESPEAEVSSGDAADRQGRLAG